MIDDEQEEGRRGEKTVLTGHMPPPVPKHVRERIQRYMDDLYFNPPTPPRYRALFERLDREASERNTPPSTKPEAVEDRRLAEVRAEKASLREDLGPWAVFVDEPFDPTWLEEKGEGGDA